MFRMQTNCEIRRRLAVARLDISEVHSSHLSLWYVLGYILSYSLFISYIILHQYYWFRRARAKPFSALSSCWSWYWQWSIRHCSWEIPPALPQQQLIASTIPDALNVTHPSIQPATYASGCPMHSAPKHSIGTHMCCNSQVTQVETEDGSMVVKCIRAGCKTVWVCSVHQQFNWNS